MGVGENKGGAGEGVGGTLSVPFIWQLFAYLMQRISLCPVTWDNKVFQSKVKYIWPERNRKSAKDLLILTAALGYGDTDFG